MATHNNGHGIISAHKNEQTISRVRIAFSSSRRLRLVLAAQAAHLSPRLFRISRASRRFSRDRAAARFHRIRLSSNRRRAALKRRHINNIGRVITRLLARHARALRHSRASFCSFHAALFAIFSFFITSALFSFCLVAPLCSLRRISLSRIAALALHLRNAHGMALNSARSIDHISMVAYRIS